MKNFYLIFSLFFALTSCEKGDIDTMDNDVSNQKGIDKTEFYSKTMSFEDLKKEKGLTGELRSLQELNDYKKGKEDSLGFFLGFNNVKYVEKNGMHSYNFPIYKPEDLEGNLENLVLVSKPSGGYKVFMVQYSFTENELLSLETEEISFLPVKVKKIKIEYASILSAIQNNLKAMQYSCNETWSMEYTCDQGMLCPNCECGRYDWVLIYKECSWYDDGTGTGGTTGGGTGSGGDGTGGGGSGSDGCEGKRFEDECNGDPEGIYSPTSPDMVEFYEKQFIKFLSSSPDLSSRDYYLNNLDNHRKDRIVSYLVNNKSSLESKEFALEALKAWDAGGEVDLSAKLINNPGLHDFLKSRMSSAEMEIFETLSIIQRAGYLKAATEAYVYAETFYPKPVRNRKGDAVKHTLWNALSTRYIGTSLTKRLTDAHEEIDYDPNYLNHFKETNMDLFNNARGRDLANHYGNLIFMIEEALDDGELRYLNNLIYKNGFYNATSDSQLVPTNR